MLIIIAYPSHRCELNVITELSNNFYSFLNRVTTFKLRALLAAKVSAKRLDAINKYTR